MLVESKQYYQDALSVTNATSLREFMQSYFMSVLTPDYPSDVIDLLQSTNPARLDNPEYLKFYALTLLSAAQFGFVEATGQRLRHICHSYKRDYMDPRHLLALDNYLAQINIQSYDQKMAIIKEKSRKKGSPLSNQDLEAIWGQYGLVYNAKVEARPPAGKAYSLLGATRSLVCLPDIAHLKQVADINFSGLDADNMPKEDFINTKLPFVRAVYSKFVNPDQIFFAANEPWGEESNSEALVTGR